jgi:hypothetical protein
MEYRPEKEPMVPLMLVFEVEHLHDLIRELQERVETLEGDLHDMQRVFHSPWWHGGKL